MISIVIRKQLGAFMLDAAFDAPAGVTAVFGRSGSGKTSLINVIAGLLRPDAGQVIVDGTDLSVLPVERRRIGYVFQDARLFPHLSVRQNLRFGGTHDEANLIDLLGLAPLLERRPATLSGGEKQRVALGRALMSDPRLLLMDEPLAALDAPRKAEILPYLERLRDTLEMPILYVSHAMSEVARLATTLVILQDGHVLRAGPLAEVLSDPEMIPLIGVREAGAVLTGRVVEVSAADGLSRLRFSGGDLVLPGKPGRVGQQVRLRVLAQDVILARDRPEGLSALNIWPVRIDSLTSGGGPGVAVVLRAGNDRLMARITRRSAAAMRLEPGQEVFAILKATAVAPADVGT